MAKQNAVQAALRQLGLDAAGQACYGSWNGYAVTFRHSAPYYDLDVAVRLDKKNRAVEKTLRAALKQRLPKRVVGCVNHGDHLTFSLALDPKTPYADQLRHVLETVTAALAEQGVSPADTCAVCGREHPDSLCLIHAYQPVHASCVRSVTDQTRQAAENNARQGSHLTGFLGGVVGMLVGLVPSLLSILLADRIYAVLFALVPLCAMWGYRKLWGKRDAAAIVIVILLSVLGVFVLELLVVAISIKQEFGMGLRAALLVTCQYLLTAEGIGVMLQESLTELFFMAIGAFLSWRFLAQTNHSQMAAVETVRSTLQPLNGHQEDPEWSEK